MKKHRLLLIVPLLAVTTAAMAQHVSFASEEIEHGVKSALGLAAEDEVPTAMADTLTTLTLHGRGLTDVSDLLYFPALRELDLSDNELEGISPLQLLDSLQVLDVSRNRLESIDMLYFTQSDSMRVNVSWNHIGDFSIFYSFSHCRFTIDGLYLQTMKDEPQFDVCHFYCDLDGEGKPYLYYRIISNNADSTVLRYESHTATLTADGLSRPYNLDNEVTETTMAVAACGTNADTTYIVPVLTDKALAGETNRYDIGLPDDYSFGYLHCQQGEVRSEGNRLEYVASDTLTSDVIDFCYLKGSTLKGFSRLYLTEGIPSAIETIAEETMTLRSTAPEQLMVDVRAPWLGDTAMVTVFSAQGRQVAAAIVDGRSGIHTQLNLPGITQQTVIVQIDSAKQTLIGKTFVE